MKHIISLFIVMSVLWVLLSAHFEPLLLGLGLASVCLTIFIAVRMDVVDHESHPFHLTFKLLKFWVLLFWEIIVSNYDVAMRVLGVRPISPTVVTVPTPHKTDLGRVIYANSITLTPGTVSIQMKPDSIVVHALSEDGAKALETGYLAGLVPEIEKGQES